MVLEAGQAGIDKTIKCDKSEGQPPRPGGFFVGRSQKSM